ncbi:MULTISPECIES: hypothetical protein [unclassified Isoptericola]|uniref:hypothetical protein n=1 Tax=unclassified Isoptericola TaxID=2623355 RepID=UPI00365FCCEF
MRGLPVLDLAGREAVRPADAERAPPRDAPGATSWDVVTTRRFPPRAPDERFNDDRADDDRLLDERLVDDRLVDDRLVDERLVDERLVDARVVDERADEAFAPPDRAPPPDPDLAEAPRAAPFGACFGAGFEVDFAPLRDADAEGFFGAGVAPPLPAPVVVPRDVVPRGEAPERPDAPERAPAPREVLPPRRPSSARATGHPSVSNRTAPLERRGGATVRRAGSPTTEPRRRPSHPGLVRATEGYTPPWL